MAFLGFIQLSDSLTRLCIVEREALMIIFQLYRVPAWDRLQLAQSLPLLAQPTVWVR